MNENKIINMSKKTFITVVIMLFALILFATTLTYILPKGEFGTITNPDGTIITDYSQYIVKEGATGINIFKGIFSPIMVVFTDDGLSLIMLSIFLLVVTGAFQIMSDCNGMKVIVSSMIHKFKGGRKQLVALITLVFMLFGSFFGLFEEMLALYPLIIVAVIGLGYDSYTAFLCCIIASAFGFSSAITNPFTVVLASETIGVSPMSHVWYRIIIFILMYGLLMAYILLHIRKIEKDPTKSPTYENDLNKKDIYTEEPIENSKTIGTTYTIFLLAAIAIIITVVSIKTIRSYVVVFLLAYFLIAGIIAGLCCTKNIKTTMKSFIKGVITALPTILLILMAASIKYILVEGSILPTITNSISRVVEGKHPIVLAILIYVIILVLEFFISSSTAKAIFVMGILSCVSIDLTKEMQVLVYLFGDGFTNVLYPTSPVLLISLSTIGMNYLSWLKHSKWLFLTNFILVIILIIIGIYIGY